MRAVRCVEGRMRAIEGRPGAIDRQETTGCVSPISLLHETAGRIIMGAKGGRMVCQRCRGLLVCLKFDELREEWQRGEDSVVRANRLNPPVLKMSLPRGVRKRGMFLRLS